MSRRHYKMCRSPLHADDTHAECVSCLGKSHADAALSGTDCSHCESFSLASLRSRIAFFSERDYTSKALPFSSSQGPVRKKQRGRGIEQPVCDKRHHRGSIRLSSSPNTISVPLRLRPTTNWMTAFLWWRLTRKSYRAL